MTSKSNHKNYKKNHIQAKQDRLHHMEETKYSLPPQGGKNKEDRGGRISEEELEWLRKSFTSALEEEIINFQRPFIEEIKKRLQPMVLEYGEKAINWCQETTGYMRREQERSLTGFQKLLSETRLTCIFLSVLASLLCALMAAGLFYFYPRQVSIAYNMSLDQAEGLFYGSVLRDNFDQLHDDDKKMFKDEIKKRLNRLKKGKPVE